MFDLFPILAIFRYFQTSYTLQLRLIVFKQHLYPRVWFILKVYHTSSTCHGFDDTACPHFLIQYHCIHSCLSQAKTFMHPTHTIHTCTSYQPPLTLTAIPNNLPDLFLEIEWLFDALASSNKYNNHSIFTLLSSSELKIQMLGRLTKLQVPSPTEWCQPRPKCGEQQATAAVGFWSRWANSDLIFSLLLLPPSFPTLYTTVIFLFGKKYLRGLRNSH